MDELVGGAAPAVPVQHHALHSAAQPSLELAVSSRRGVAGTQRAHQDWRGAPGWGCTAWDCSTLGHTPSRKPHAPCPGTAKSMTIQQRELALPDTQRTLPSPLLPHCLPNSLGLGSRRLQSPSTRYPYYSSTTPTSARVRDGQSSSSSIKSSHQHRPLHTPPLPSVSPLPTPTYPATPRAHLQVLVVGPGGLLHPALIPGDAAQEVPPPLAPQVAVEHLKEE